MSPTTWRCCRFFYLNKKQTKPFLSHEKSCFFFYLVIYLTKETPIFEQWHCAIPLLYSKIRWWIVLYVRGGRRRAVRRRDGSLWKRGAWTDQQAPREEIDLKHCVSESSMRNVLKLVEIILTFKTESADTVDLAIAIIITRIAVAIKCDNHLSEVKFFSLLGIAWLPHFIASFCWSLQKGKRTRVRHGFLFKTAIFVVQLTLIWGNHFRMLLQHLSCREEIHAPII